MAATIKGRWIPKNAIGVGADVDGDGWDDVTGEPTSESMWAPLGGLASIPGDIRDVVGQRVEEINQTPSTLGKIGSAASAVLFEAPANALKWGEGAVIGGMQAGAQALGVRSPDESIDVQREFNPDFSGAINSLIPWPDTIMDTIGVERPQIAGENAPLGQVNLFGDGDHTLQPTQDAGSILRPQEAVERFHAVAPPAAEFAVDVLAGWKTPVVAMKYAGKALDAAGGLLHLDRMAPAAARGPLSAKIAQALQDYSETTRGRTISAALGLGLPLGGAVVGGATGYANAPDDGGFWMVAGEVGEGALGGGIVGLGISGIGKVGGAVARLGAMPGRVHMPITAPADIRMVMDNLNRISGIQQRGSVQPILYPGGWKGQLLMNLRSAFLDTKAGAKMMESLNVARRESGVAAAEAFDELPRAASAVASAKTLLDTAGDALTAAEESLVTAGRNVDALGTFEGSQPAVIAARAALDAAQTAIKRMPKGADPLWRQAAQQTFKAAQKTLADAEQVAGEARYSAVQTPEMTAAAQRQARANAQLEVARRAKRAFGQRGNPNDPNWQMARIALRDAVSESKQADAAVRKAAKTRPETPEYEAFTAKKTATEDAAKAARIAHGDSRSAYKKMADAHAAMAAREELLQYASARGARSVPHHQRIGKLIQSLNGIGARQGAYLHEMERGVLKFGHGHIPDVGPPAPDHGLLNAVDAKDYDAWLYLRRILDQMSKGHAVKVGEDANGIDVIRRADVPWAAQQLDDFITHKLGGDVKTAGRYEQTLQMMTTKRNELLQDMVRAELLSVDDYTKMVSSGYAYIHGKDVESALVNFTQSQARGIPNAKQSFAAQRGIEHERTAETFATGVQDELQRDTLLIQLAEQNRVGLAADAARLADPLGFGLTFKEHIDPVIPEAAAHAERARTVIADLRAARNETQMLAEDVHQADSGVRMAERWIQDWTHKGADPTQDARKVQTALTRWNARLTQQQGELAARQTKLAAAKANRSMLADRLKIIRDEAGDLAVKAKKAQSGTVPTHSVETGKALWPVFKQGKMRMFETEQWFRDIGAAVDEPQMNALLSAINFMDTTWRSTVTTLSLPFMLRNPIRDAFTASQNWNKSTPLEFLVNSYVPAWGDVAKYTTTGVFEDIYRALGESSHAPDMWAKWLHDRASLMGAQNAATATAQASAQGAFAGSLASSAGALYGPGGGTARGALGAIGPFIRRLSMLSELPGRTAVFMEALRVGLSPEAAAFEARTILVDFSQAGHVLRVANLMFPLLNARVQGELQSWNSLRDNPSSFIPKAAATVGLPYMMAYAWNRTNYGDMLDMISNDVQKSNIPLIYGKWFNPDTVREEPLYLSIPLNDVAGAMAASMRLAMDMTYHTETDQGMPLEGKQRSEATMRGTLQAIIASFVPSNPRPDELDPAGLAKSVIYMNPLLSVSSQINANEDRFRGRPLIDEKTLNRPEPYQVKADTMQLSEWVSEFGYKSGVTGGYWAPAYVDFAIKQMAGAFTQPPVSLAIDGIFRMIARRTGWQPPSLTPPDPAVVPPEQYAQWKADMDRGDPRPMLQRVLPVLFKSGGAAQSIRSKLISEGRSDDVEISDQTNGLLEAMAEYDQTVYQPAINAIYTGHDEDGSINSWATRSMAAINDEAVSLSQRRREAREAMQADHYKKAITSSLERRKFLDKLPGIPVGAEFNGALQQLPPGTDPGALAQRYRQPTSVDSGIFAQMTPQDQDRARRNELTIMAREMTEQYGMPVDPKTIDRAIAIHERGGSLPSLPIPEDDVDAWVDAWMAPEGMTGDMDPAVARLLRTQALAKIVKDYGIVEAMKHDKTLDENSDLSEQQQAEAYVHEAINTKLIRLEQPHDLEISRDRAYAVAERIHDNQRTPLFIDGSGQEMGADSPELQATWMNTLAKYASIPKDRWTPDVLLIDRWRSYGKAASVRELYADPDAEDYIRWFGAGRTLSPVEWEQYQSDPLIAKYRIGGQKLNADVSMQLDYISSLYGALPDGPEKDALRGIVSRINDWRTLNWQMQFDVTALQSPEHRALQDRILELETQLSQY